MDESDKKLHALQLAREDILYFHQKSVDTILTLMTQNEENTEYHRVLTDDLRKLLNRGVFSAQEIVDRARELYAFYDKV
jgi:hypothetical protein